MNTDINQKMWIEKIHENLILRGRSEGTYRNYAYAINRFLKYFDDNTNIENLTEIEIIEYLKKEYINKNRSSKTYNVSVVSIKYFYSIIFNKELNDKLIPSCKSGKRLPKIIEKEDLIKILNDEDNLKHKLWLLLGFCSGLRVEEVSKVKIEDMSFNEHRIRIIGKGNKERCTILPDVTIRILKIYIQRKNVKSGYLFPGYKERDSVCPRTISHYFFNTVKKYNLNKNITFHSLRHSFATYFLANGGSLLSLQSMLGHRNLNTTLIYLHLSQNFNELEGIKYV